MRSGELMKWNEAVVQGSNEACFVVHTEVRGAFKNVEVTRVTQWYVHLETSDARRECVTALTVSKN